MTHVWRHPKYYRELTAQARKLTSSQAQGSKLPNLPSKAQASSPSPQAPGSKIRGTSVPSPCPGDSEQE